MADIPKINTTTGTPLSNILLVPTSTGGVLPGFQGLVSAVGGMRAEVSSPQNNNKLDERIQSLQNEIDGLKSDAGQKGEAVDNKLKEAEAMQQKGSRLFSNGSSVFPANWEMMLAGNKLKQESINLKTEVPKLRNEIKEINAKIKEKEKELQKLKEEKK